MAEETGGRRSDNCQMGAGRCGNIVQPDKYIYIYIYIYTLLTQKVLADLVVEIVESDFFRV